MKNYIVLTFFIFISSCTNDKNTKMTTLLNEQKQINKTLDSLNALTPTFVDTFINESPEIQLGRKKNIEFSINKDLQIKEAAIRLKQVVFSIDSLSKMN